MFPKFESKNILLNQKNHTERCTFFTTKKIERPNAYTKLKRNQNFYLETEIFYLQNFLNNKADLCYVFIAFAKCFYGEKRKNRRKW